MSRRALAAWVCGAVAWVAAVHPTSAQSIAQSAAPSTAAPSLLDEWWTPGFNARVRLAPCEDPAKLCGTIVWAWDDTPQGAADKRPLVGQRIIRGMAPDGPAASAGGQVARHSGQIYNPEDGQTYKATLRLKSPNTLLVEGCVLFICKEQVWRRWDSLRSPPVAL